MHYRELRREVRLLALAHESDYPLAKTLSDLFGSLDRDLRAGHPERGHRVGAGGRRDHDRPAGQHAARRRAQSIGRFLELLDLADAFCREERLLSLARTPEQRALPAVVPRRVRAPGARRSTAGVARRTRAGPHQRRVSRPSAPPRAVAVVAAGGAGGAVLRWLLGELAPDGSGFPWTTFGINVVGSFLLAAAARARGRPPARRCWRSPSGPGVLGGFTTLSTYAEQGRGLLADGRPALAAAYLFGTLAACLVGVALAHRLSTPADQWAFDDEEGNE